MKITVCIGSSCHLKGSKEVIGKLQDLIAKNGLENNVELCGAFCMGNCTNKVSVKLDDLLFSLDMQDVDDFFNNQVLKNI